MSYHLNFLIILSVYILLAVNTILGQTKSDYADIKSLSGEPDYRSINLTWEVENETETSARGFTVFYCEMQTWGPQRCKSKSLNNENLEMNVENPQGNHRAMRQYSMIIDKLRMATKYSFQIKPQMKPGEQKATGRADLGDTDLFTNKLTAGETIVIPTKGFSAHATRCLPQASEIEVETGPFFGGRIVAESGDCGIQGDPKDPRDRYTMRIEHDKCGSRVNHEDLTVETFITVQENLGIFTHSTRRFLVLCTYQPDTLTVRAGLSLPGKGGATAVSHEWLKEGRNARERQFRMVGKNALVLKENDPDREKSIDETVTNEDTENSVGVLEELSTKNDEKENRAPKMVKVDFNINNNNNKNNNHFINENKIDQYRDVRYSKLVDDRHSIDDRKINEKSTVDHTGLAIAVCLTIIMAGTFIYIMQRENKKQKLVRLNQMVRTNEP